MVKVYNPNDFMLEFDNIYSAWEYTTYCGGLDITVICYL